MKQIIALLLLTSSLTVTAALREPPLVNVDVDRLIGCSVYHTLSYPLYANAFLNTAGILYHQNSMGVLDFAEYSELKEFETETFSSLSLNQKGAALMHCQQFLTDLITEYDVIAYSKRLQGASQ